MIIPITIGMSETKANIMNDMPTHEFIVRSKTAANRADAITGAT